jgi:hypothetical protein
MDLDTVEQRYLITAAADSTIEAFDVLVSLAGLAAPSPIAPGSHHHPLHHHPLHSHHHPSQLAGRCRFSGMRFAPQDQNSSACSLTVES